MATAGRAILFSGLTVAIGLSGLLFYTGTALVSMGVAGRDRRRRLRALRRHAAARDARDPRAAASTACASPSCSRSRSARARGIGSRPGSCAGPGWCSSRRSRSCSSRARRSSTCSSPTATSTSCPRPPRRGRVPDLLQAQFPQVGTNTIAVVIDFDHGSPTSPANVATAYAVEPALCRRCRESPSIRSYVTVDPTVTLAGYQSLYAQPRGGAAGCGAVAADQPHRDRASRCSTSPTRTS